MNISDEELVRLRRRIVIPPHDETSFGHPKRWAEHLRQIADRIRNGPQPSIVVAREKLYFEEPGAEGTSRRGERS